MSNRFLMAEDVEFKNVREFNTTDHDIYKILKEEKNFAFSFLKLLLRDGEDTQ